MKTKSRVLTGISCILIALMCILSIVACGDEPENNECAHEWGEWETTTPATCTEAGVQTRVCAHNSEHTETRSIKANGHSYGEYVSDENASCTADGTKTATCEVCSKTDTVIDEGSALDHDYSISVVDEKYLKSAANCTDKAVYYKTCACGAVSEEDTFEYGSVAHSYKTELSKDETHHWYECSECADKSSVKAHNWDLGKVTTEPTATKEGKKLFTCSDCGQTKETSVPKKSHAHAPVRTAAVAATCYKDGNIEYWYCAGCGKYFSNSDLTREVFEENLVVPALNHKNITVELVVKAGCETPGYTTYGCADCDYTYDVEIPATGHSWAVSSTIEADCQTIGYTLYECSACHEQKKTDITPKTDCEETSAVTKEASCTENGEITYTCSTCGGTRTETIAKSGHEYDSVVTAPTCTTDGYTTHTCIHGCGSVYTDTVVKTSGHNWNTTHVDETCTTPGSDTSVCSVCNEVQTVVIPASGHDWVAATCTADGYCETCNAPGEPCHGHNYADEIDNVAASCSANGYIEYACTYEGCDSKTRTTTEDYKAKGHNLEAITWDTSLVLVDADHCMYANERSGVCPDCHETVKNTSEPFEKHAYVAAITTAATCCEGGLKTYTCKDCGHSYEEGYAKVDDAHSWGTGVLQADGVTTVYTCANDHSHTKVSVSAKQETETTVSASGIKNSNDVELKNATFVPSEELKDSIGESEDVKLSADILKDDAYDNAMSQLSQADRDRLKQGNIFNFTMEVGNQQLSNLGGAMTVRVPYTLDVENGEDPEDIVIAYINGSKIELKEAVYMEIDNQGYAVFETTHFSYYTVTKLTAEERCAIYGHVESTKVVPATCLTDGYTVTVCLRCGKKTVKDIVAALGHNWMLNEATHVEHSCTVDGVEEYECSRCQIDYKVVTKALGHNWYADEENTYGASCTEAGANAYKCDVCSGTYTETIPAIGHDFVDVEIKQATCVEGGYTDRECQSCGERIRTDVTNPTEHNIIDVVVAPTCVEKGYTAHYCDECGKTFANTNEIDVVAHKWNIKKADCVTDKVCTVCNARGEKAHGHSMTKDGMCEHCGMPCEHDYVLKGTIDSTCVSRGYDVYVCSVCLGTHHGNYKDLADHEYKFVETVAPTCAKEGYDVYACEHCKIKTYRNYTDKVEHQYTFSYTIDATCSSPEYRVDECSVCGKTKKTETAPALSHVFENGKCKNCGISSDLFYLTMLNSWSNVKGAAFKLNNLSVITENLDTKFADGSVWVESENISLIKIPELMLYVDDDGKLCGAAYGALSIVEGVGMSATVYSIKAVIEGDDIYIEMSEETNGNAETYYVRVSIEYIMSQMLSESGLTEVASWAAVYVLPIISNLNGESAEFLDNFIGSLINMLFSKEETVDATVYSLDFEKLSELNENIAALNVGELVDTYFGEGFYAKLAADLEKLMAVNVSDILDYLDEAGVPKDKVVAAIDSLLAIAMNEEFSIEEMLQSPELEGVTVADMLSAMLEVEEFDIAALMEQLADINIYEQMGSVSQAKAAIKSIIEMVEDSIGLSFAVNAEGKTTEINLDVKDLVVGQSDSYRITLSAGIDITIDGRIEVSWSDIADKIDGMIPEDVFVFDDEVVYSDPEIMGGGGNRPDEDYCDIHYDKDGDGCCDKCGIRFEHYEPVECDHYDNDGDGCCDKCGLGFAQKDNIIDKEVVYKDINLVSFEIDSGVVEYKGKEYMVESIWYEQSRCTYVYSEFVAVMIMQDCGDWVSYDLVFKTVYDSVNLQMIYLLDTETENPSYILIYNEETDEQIEISLDYENESMTALFPDGTVADINPEMQMSDLGEYYPEDWWVTYRTSSENETIYYNSATGEVEFESQHKYELDEEKSFAAENCGDYGCYYYVCTECGDIDSHNYRKNHTHIWKYVLNENSNSCEEGVDEVLICVECGHIDHREENVRFEHCESNCITYENGDVYSAIICSACGKQMSAKEKIYTLITDENLVPNQDNLMGSYDKGSFIFVPSKTGIYELYSNGYGSAYVQNNDGYHMSGDLGSGIELYLEEGVSYKITINYIYGKGEASVYFNARTVREIDLAQYGSDCGGKIIVTSRFLEVDVQLECNCAFESMNDRMSVCSECGFKFFVDEGYTLDECCNEIVYCVYRFGKSEAEFNQNAYEVYAYKTGSVNHSAVSEHNNGRYESVDEYGNPITIEYEEKIDTCENCGHITYLEKTTYTYDSDKVCIEEKFERYEYSSNLNSAYLSYESVTKREKVAYDGGFETIENHYSYACYDDNGNIYKSYSRDVVRSEDNPCRVDYIINDNGDEYTNVEYLHLYSWKTLEDECSDVNATDEYGNPIRIITYSEEKYCDKCYGSFEKNVQIKTEDVNGCEIKHENQIWKSYANSDTDFGYYLYEAVVSERGVFEYSEGKRATYITRYSSYIYDADGNVIEGSARVYDYTYGNYCHALVTETPVNGEVTTYEYNQHVDILCAWRLKEGSHSCFDGVEKYYYCVSCDYEEVSDTAKYHVNSNLNPTIINIADYGASCGGCIEIYYCPCRERAFVNNCFNCDMDVESQWYKDVEGKENHYKYTYTCAVTDPEQCRFAYTEETWSAYDEQCRRTQYYVYTFGINTDNPLVISYKISENYSNHSFSNEILDNDDQIVDGITKNTVHGRNCCVRCGFVESYFTEVKTYDENRRYLSRDYTVELYNNSGEMTSKSIYSYIVAYANDGHYSEFQTHYIEYFYDENGTINNWFEREYNYPNGYCRAVVTERNSNGYEYTYFENHCIDYYDEVIQQPTCSQKGKYNRICYWCEESFEFDENPNGHSYEYMDGEYVCCICGIHNANGADGNVILEDLTEEYGYGEYIVMGYFFRWSFDYVVVASLVVDGVEEPIILETVFAEDDGESIIRVSIANLAAEAEMLGYSISDVNVKLNIVPLGGGTEFDYAITFDAIAAE